MSAHDNGGPAFPHQKADGSPYWGMSLRDWFAGQALAGICANPGGPFQSNPMNGWDLVNCTPEKVARVCGEIADAMIEQRGEP